MKHGPSQREIVVRMVAEALGHTFHCACRIAFGDGACECIIVNVRSLDGAAVLNDVVPPLPLCHFLMPGIYPP